MIGTGYSDTPSKDIVPSGLIKSIICSIACPLAAFPTHSKAWSKLRFFSSPATLYVLSANEKLASLSSFTPKIESFESGSIDFRKIPVIKPKLPSPKIAILSLLPCEKFLNLRIACTLTLINSINAATWLSISSGTFTTLSASRATRSCINPSKPLALNLELLR